jgi:hypothetical protein
MEKREKPWYVGERAELLARLFLQDLGASVWAPAQDEYRPFDAIATFLTYDEKPRITANQVKATEQPVGEEFRFQADPKAIRALQHSNVPVLFLIVDAKHNQVYYGWARDLRYDPAHGKGKRTVRCSLPVVAAPERKGELLNAILSQPDVAECAG